jgi:hypothetical protein
VNLVVAVGAEAEEANPDQFLDPPILLGEGSAQPRQLDEPVLFLPPGMREAAEPRASGGVYVLGLLESVVVCVVAIDADVGLRSADFQSVPRTATLAGGASMKTRLRLRQSRL